MANPPYQGKGFLVFGASGGIGSHVCRLLAADGARVMLAGRNLEKLEALSNELDMPTAQLDATDLEQVENAFQEASEQFGGLSGAVNLCGTVLIKPAHLTSPQEWQETIAQNLTTSFNTVRTAAATMKQYGGSVVLMTSSAARVGLPNHEAIAAAKGGVIGLTLSAAASYAHKNIRINAVSPGLVKTPLTERIWNNERAAEASRQFHALGRLGEPEEVARAVHFLLNPANDWISGQVFAIDGGLGTLRASAGK